MSTVANLLVGKRKSHKDIMGGLDVTARPYATYGLDVTPGLEVTA